MGSDENHFNVSVGSDGQSHKAVSTVFLRICFFVVVVVVAAAAAAAAAAAVVVVVVCLFVVVVVVRE